MSQDALRYPDFSLAGKVACVTASSRGLGKWMALALAHAGADLAVTYREAREEGEEVARAIRDMGRRALLTRLDAGDPQSIAAMFGAIRAEFGRLDVMVNNAGVNVPKKALDITPADFDFVTGVNLRGTFLCCQEAARMMMTQGGGKIINIASAAAFLVRKGISISVYATTKAGLVMMTKALAVEWAGSHINVNALAPGYFPTPLTEKRLQDPKFLNSVLDSTPLGRVGEPGDIMSSVLFLATSASDFITGQTLSLDGGRTVL